MATLTRNLKRILKNFQPDHLIDICEREETDFASFGEMDEVADGDFYVYQDNGADVLGIAHLDSVQGVNSCNIFTTKHGSPIVFSPNLDDRLGAWVIVDLLPRVGIKTDWLLTVGEEMGMSTGSDFVRHHRAQHGKPYKWMFQFDRTGTDVVSYDYDTPELRARLKSVGMKPASGSFSDISMMDDLGCIGFNVGVGYQDYHSKRAYAWLDDTFGQVARFMNFYYRYGDVSMPHVKPVRVWGWRTYTQADGTSKTYRSTILKRPSELTPDDELVGDNGYYVSNGVRDSWLRKSNSTRYLSPRELREATLGHYRGDGIGVNDGQYRGGWTGMTDDDLPPVRHYRDSWPSKEDEEEWDALMEVGAEIRDAAEAQAWADSHDTRSEIHSLPLNIEV